MIEGEDSAEYVCAHRQGITEVYHALGKRGRGRCECGLFVESVALILVRQEDPPIVPH